MAARRYTLALLTCVAGPVPLWPQFADSLPPAEALIESSEWTHEFRGKTVADLFGQVVRGIQYEPYARVQRGARGTALSSSGYAWDQGALLAKLLRERGYRVRTSNSPDKPRVNNLLRDHT